MIRLYKEGAYLRNGQELLPFGTEGAMELEKKTGRTAADMKKAEGTMARAILEAHNLSGNMERLRIRFDKLTSHDITFVGIIQTARASGLERFPMPYVLTNCHNSLCAVGGTINEDDHMFGLSCAKRYGGVYVPPHQAVIHQFAREMLAGCGQMILGSDSHTRYGALGTMAMGEGGPELVKQLLRQTYDIPMPEVVAVYLKGEPRRGVGPQDVAIALIGAVFESGFVKNRVLEFVGPGVKHLSADFRIGVDVMTTETTCLSSIWTTDETIREFFEIHGRPEAYRQMEPEETAVYDRCVEIDLSEIEPMIALPFHPSNAVTIREFKDNLEDMLAEVEKRAKVSFGDGVDFTLRDKITDRGLYVDQGIIAGCAGGGFENICAAADLLRGRTIGCGEFSLSVYPASMPIYKELAVNGVLADLAGCGAVVKTAFCGPCFGAGDTPANRGFSIRHSTRNFPNREGSKPTNGQVASVALMDARSIAATAANQGYLTGADEMDTEYTSPKYHFDSSIYEGRVFDSHGEADPSVPVRLGPNIKDWPAMPALPGNLVLKVVSEIHDPVTTTDELIPSGETSSFRSNPEGLAQFTLSRKDPAYVGRAKAVREERRALEEGEAPGKTLPELPAVLACIGENWPDAKESLSIGSVIFAVKPGDGSAREQAASCQKVLGGWANIANSYATKRYRSNLINWGMLPFVIEEGALPFKNLDYLFLPDIRAAVEEKREVITAYALGDGGPAAFTLTLGDLTDEERRIILDGCLINYNRRKASGGGADQN